MKVVLQLIILCVSILGWTQNLVKNPSFEDYIECPNDLGTFEKHVNFWSTPSAGTSDYFNKCSTIMGAPQNFNGEQEPVDGNAYAGIYFIAPGDYREYLQAELQYQLEENQEYILSFYISLAEGSDFAIKDFGVVLSEEKLDLKTKKNLSKGELFRAKKKFQEFEIHENEFHKNRSNWIKLETSFIASGFENYLILGNLRTNKTTRKEQAKRKQYKKGAYYYIDLVELKNAENTTSIIHKFKKDSVYTFKNIHFDFDKFILTKEAKVELNGLYKTLIAKPDYTLEIHAHTDDYGSEDYNQKLSGQRAKAIESYFLQRAIPKTRIVSVGHGSSKPLKPNSSEENRQLNRRAEFTLRQTKIAN